MKNVSNADSDRGRFFIPLRARDDSKFLNLLETKCHFNRKRIFIRCQQNTKNVSNADSDRGRFFIPLRVRDDSKFLNLLEKGNEKSKNEILKLKELPNERLEGFWGALWLGIRTFVGLKLGVVGLLGPKTKS